MNEKESNLAFYETLGTIFWLLVDFCWLMEFKVLLLITAVPTIIFISFVLFRYSGRFSDFAANCAMLGWALMSVLWALDDLWQIPTALTLAKYFVSFSLIFLVLFLVVGDFRREVIARFRRFRVPRS